MSEMEEYINYIEHAKMGLKDLGEKLERIEKKIHPELPICIECNFNIEECKQENRCKYMQQLVADFKATELNPAILLGLQRLAGADDEQE